MLLLLQIFLDSNFCFPDTHLPYHFLFVDCIFCSHENWIRNWPLNTMAGVASRGRPPKPPSIASPQTSDSRRSTPLGRFKRPTKSQQGQRKRQRPSEPLKRLQEQSEPASQSALNSERLDAEIRAEEVNDESLDHVIMAIDIRDRDAIGCAYYVAREQSLRCMEDVIGGGREVLDICQ